MPLPKRGCSDLGQDLFNEFVKYPVAVLITIPKNCTFLWNLVSLKI